MVVGNIIKISAFSVSGINTCYVITIYLRLDLANKLVFILAGLNQFKTFLNLFQSTNQINLNRLWEEPIIRDMTADSSCDVL